MVVYAVKKGHRTGKFYSWEDCQKATSGYSGAQFKKFKSEYEADEYLGIKTAAPKCLLEPMTKEELSKAFDNSGKLSEEVHKKHTEEICKSLPDGEAVAYTDGSYDKVNSVLGFGCVLYTKEGETVISGCDNDPAFTESWNISGELVGAILAVKEAIRLGYQKVTIYHDLEGVAAWGTGRWKANKLITKMYVAYIAKARKYIYVDFQWVKGHSGVLGNERVDKIASTAIKDKKMFSVADFFRSVGLL